MAATAVRVALRVRPLTEKERLCNCTECISFLPGQPQILIGQDYSFTYDYIFDTKAHQKSIYDSSVLPLVEKFVDGFNATILAYGQTGSGKTYSMGTAIDANMDSEEHQGIIPRFIDDLYARLAKKKAVDENYDYEVYVSFLELYNEDLVDLLNMQQFGHQRRRTGSNNGTTVPTCDISIREDIQGNIYWNGVREEPCADPNELLGFLAKGSLCRTTGSTDMNSVSSRSHAIFSVILKQQVPDDDESSQKTIVSKFHFVDLAGSERLKRTKAQGDRAREGIAINSGLLALGNVISALGDESRKCPHVPYRDSKLTRLLQDSLGGNSQTLMMACVSPSDSNFRETLSTLKYANRARNIKNRVSINQEFAGSSVEVNQLRSQVAKLKMELNTIRRSGAGGGSALMTNPGEVEGLRQEINRLRARVQEASDELCAATAERDTLLMERDMRNVSAGDLPQLLDELMMKHNTESGEASQGPPSASSTTHSLPMIAHYQKTISNLRNELADTKERLAFVESTRAPMMQALAMASHTTPNTSFTTASRPAKQPSSTTTRRRNRRKTRNGSTTTRGQVAFRSSRASKVPNKRRAAATFAAARVASKEAQQMQQQSAPRPPIPVTESDNQDIEQWLQDTVGSVNFSESTDVRTAEVRDSIEKARAEIEKGLKVLEEIKPREHEYAQQQHQEPVPAPPVPPASTGGNYICDIMADDELLQTLQAKENAFIFSELEHEMLDDEFAAHKNEDSSDDNCMHSRQSSMGALSSCDESELAALCETNPQLARMIEQVQSDIHVKEELVAQLERCESEYIQLRKKYKLKLDALSQEIIAVKRERDHAARRSATSTQHSKHDQREKQQLLEMRHAYEAKTKSLFAQLTDLRHKYSQTTSAIQSSRNQNESMLRALRVNVESLKLEKRRMLKRMKEEAERVKEKMTAHEREIHQLRRRQARDTEAKRRLERENKNVQMMLQKRTDEVVLTNEKLKKLIQVLKKAVREGGVLNEKQLARCADLVNIGSALVSSGQRLKLRSSASASSKAQGRKRIPYDVRAARKKQLLDRALYQFIQGKQAIAEMQQLIAKRSELSQKKAELLSERSTLFADRTEGELAQLDQAVQQYMDERLEFLTAEISYINARIHALQNDAAHEIMQGDDDDDEEVVDISQVQSSTPRTPKHVTFADEVMGYTPKEDEWLDMDALEERYSLPANADPDTAHDMVARLLRSVAHDESGKIIEALVDDITALRMAEYSREMQLQELEKNVNYLQRTLIVMKDKAIETSIESEKRIKRLQQQINNQQNSRRSSLSGSTCHWQSSSEDLRDDDSAIDLRVEEHYQQFGTIFDKIYQDGISGYQHNVSRAQSPDLHVSDRADSIGSRTPPVGPSPILRPASTTGSASNDRNAPMKPSASPLASRRDSMSSPEKFLQELMHAGGLIQPQSPRMKAADFVRYQADRESSSSSSIHSNHLRRSSIQSDKSWSSQGSSSSLRLPQQAMPPQPMAPQPQQHSSKHDLIMSRLANRRRAHSFQQQPQPLSKAALAARERRRYSLRELSVGGNSYTASQPSPLQQQFAIPVSPPLRPASVTSNHDDSQRPGTPHNVFDRLASGHTKASQAKRTATPVQF